MAQKIAEDYRRWNQDVSGHITIAATDDDQTLVTVRNANSTIYVQTVIAYITTDAAQSWSFEDSNGTAKKACKVTTSPGVDTRWQFDFGPRGLPLTEGKNFLLNVSAVGLAGTIEWYGYSRLTSAVAPGTTN